MIALPLMAVLAMSSVSQSQGPRKPAPTWTMELRFAPYRPAISDRTADKQYFSTVFRKGLKNSLFKGQPILTSLEVDYYLLTHLGLVGLVGRVGYWNVTGKARVCENGAGETVSCHPGNANSAVSNEGNTPVSLTMLPLSVALSYRFNLIQQRYGLPIQPYAKGGLDYHLWWTRANGKVASADRDGDGKSAKGQGGTLGFHLSAGIAVGIDWLDPTVRRNSANSTGLSATYLFFEGTTVQASGLGRDGKLDASDNMLLAGLALDFR